MSEELEPTNGEDAASTEAAESGASQTEETEATQSAETGEQVASGEQVAERQKVPTAVQERFSEYATKLRETNTEREEAVRERDELRAQLAAIEQQGTTKTEQPGNQATPPELAGMEYDPNDQTVFVNGQWVPAEPIVRAIRAEQRSERVEQRLTQFEQAQQQAELDKSIGEVTRLVTDELQTERAKVFGNISEEQVGYLDNLIGFVLKDMAPGQLSGPQDVAKLTAVIPKAVAKVRDLMANFSNEQIKANLAAAESQIPAAEGLAGVQGKKRLVEMTKAEQEAYYANLDKQVMNDTLRSGP
jgi:hypothetical protein